MNFMEHFLLQLVLGSKQCCGSINFSTYQTGPGIRVYSFCFSPCLACTGMEYHFKNFIPVEVLGISSNAQCVTVPKYKTLLETGDSTFSVHCLVSPPSSPPQEPQMMNYNIVRDYLILTAYANNCSWPIRNTHLLKRHNHFLLLALPGRQW